MRFCAPDSAGDGLASACAFARSPGPTGLALRTSGSPDVARAAETAVAFGAIVGMGETDGAVVGADATLRAGVSAVAVGGAVVELGVDPVPGEIWAVGSARLGASRCKLRINFITPKPITNTRMPKMSGIGEMRSRLEWRTWRTAGALTGLGGGLS